MRISDWSSDVCSSDLTYRAAPVSSIYGGTPSLTGTATAAGLKNSDTLESVTDGAAAWTSLGGATSDIGAYAVTGRSEERRVGQECVSTCRSRGSAAH